MSVTKTTVRVWDLPTRLFHWLLALCFVGSFVTVKTGGFWMDYHLWFGYATLALLLFRLVWGVVGPEHARFHRFLRGPAAVVDYVRGRQPGGAGHSPLGALSVVAMLLALSVQAVSGLFADDGIFTAGPLATTVSAAASDTLTAIHQTGEPILLVLIGLHLLAIVWYTVVRRRSIVKAMVTGDKPAAQVPERTPPTPDDASVRARALIVAAMAAGLVYLIVRQGGGFA
ncbi:cytochrome b/b6 domain-containing protein [Achromobacter sp. GG226]|uniref:cytochrome b/b6 domain-containing protein n=1 Tax=Verticiella alkaliphila TaxID=2779529 RepID=UPI001C0B4A7F|nr:cytochrome b/b6 domain-containing protein [Verticiella sp. GG226]